MVEEVTVLSRGRCLSLCRSSSEVVGGGDTRILGTIHSTTFRSFHHLNFPSQGMRECGCASVDTVFRPSCNLGLGHLRVPMSPCRTFHYSMPGLDASLCFIMGSTFCYGTLPGMRLPRNIVISSLGGVTTRGPRFVKGCCTGVTGASRSNVATLGAFLTRSNLLVCIPGGIGIRQAVRIVGVLHSSISLVIGHHILVIVRRNTRTGFLFYSRTTSSGGFLTARMVRTCMNRGTDLSLCYLRRARCGGHHIDGICVRRRTGDHIGRGIVALRGNVAHGHLSLMFGNRKTRYFYGNYIVTSGGRIMSGGALVSRRINRYADGRLCGCMLSNRTHNTFTNEMLIHRNTRGAASRRAGRGLYTAGATHVFARPVLRVCTSSIGYTRNDAINRLGSTTLFCVRRHKIDHRRTGLLLRFTFVGRIVSGVRLRPLHSHLRRLMRGQFHNRLGGYRNYGLYG